MAVNQKYANVIAENHKSGDIGMYSPACFFLLGIPGVLLTSPASVDQRLSFDACPCYGPATHPERNDWVLLAHSIP